MTTVMESPATAINMRLAKRWIPKGSTEIKHALAVFYTQEGTRAENKPYFSVMCYIGTAGKSAYYETYRRAEDRDKRIAETIRNLESSAAMKSEWRTEREKPHTLEVGDIIHHSWGYDQTQCDFYQIIAVTPHGATIRAIRSASVEGRAIGSMSEMQTAVKDGFCGEPLRVRISGQNSVTTLEHGSASKWDGKPKYCSWYA